MCHRQGTPVARVRNNSDRPGGRSLGRCRGEGKAAGWESRAGAAAAHPAFALPPMRDSRNSGISASRLALCDRPPAIGVGRSSSDLRLMFLQAGASSVRGRS